MTQTKKIHYRRSTPVIRLRRNVGRMIKISTLLTRRFSTWQVSENQAAQEAIERAKEVAKALRRLDEAVGLLQSQDFRPPRRTSFVSFDVGQTVAIRPKFRGKYESAFEKILVEDPEMLDGLVVVKILEETGEIAVRRGQRTPFLVRKSHLVAV
jgi:hypothetical protein